MEDLRGRLDSLPIIVREQTMRQQRLIGRQSMGEFNDKVYETVRRVPRGKVVSYGQVARLIGQPRKARFVGMPCTGIPTRGIARLKRGFLGHRVVFKDGSLAPGFAFGGPDEQRARLTAEGVTFLDDGRVDMRECNGTAGAARARTAAKRLRSQLRRRSISIGPLSWANKQLVLSQLLWQLPYLRCKPSTRALATRRPSQAADIMPPA